jgi:hypothetical protein
MSKRGINSGWVVLRHPSHCCPGGPKLTPYQFRWLRDIPDEGVSGHTTRNGRATYTTAQLRTLRSLVPLGLVAETQGEQAIRFQITDAGRELVRPSSAR